MQGDSEPDQVLRPIDQQRVLTERLRLQTPARVLVGRCGPALLTGTQLELRSDHAAALDAVHTELNLVRDFSADFVQRWGLFEVETCAQDRQQYLMRPDLGRVLSDIARSEIKRRCPRESALQIVIGDGLSSAAVVANVPGLLPRLDELATERGLDCGQPFAVRFCRVGVLNDIGECLRPQVVVLLIGERPGLATATSLSAYMAYRPRTGHTDAKRNLISNIHGRGVTIEHAAQRIVALAQKMITVQVSGVSLKE